MSKYEWYHLAPTNLDAFEVLRDQVHIAIQNVALVGRQYLPTSEEDENATLYWVPGFWRIAGKWVRGEKTFRSSISLRDFHLYLVDEKVVTLDHFKLHGQTFQQTMLWLEQHIGSLNLGHKSLTIDLPYTLPLFDKLVSKPFTELNEDQYMSFGGYYHDTFVVLSELRGEFNNTSEVRIWPHHFDMAMMITLKETGDPTLNTSVSAGFSPGDVSIKEPYFYVNCWPHADPNQLGSLPNGSYWNSDGWVGGVLPVNAVWKTPHQKNMILDFFRSGISQLTNALLS